MFSSVRSRLTVWYAAVLSCSLLLLSLVIYFIVKESVLARMDASLVELSDSFLATLEAELSDAPAAEGITGASRQSMLEHQYPGHSFAVLTATDGAGRRAVMPILRRQAAQDAGVSGGGGEEDDVVRLHCCRTTRLLDPVDPGRAVFPTVHKTGAIGPGRCPGTR